MLWTRASPADAETVRVLPDGCLDLIWSSRSGLLVAGPDRRAHLGPDEPGQWWVGLRLPPGVGPAVLGVPADELRDRRVPLADLWGAGPADRVALSAVDVAPRSGGGDPGRWPGSVRPPVDLDRVARALEAVAVDRLDRPDGPDPVGLRVAALLAAGTSVAATAAGVGLDARALHRRCHRLFGYGPKTLARILRMRRALAMARTGTPLAEVAVSAGYADQAHLSRDVRELAGVPPRVLLDR
ncbi:helix-turn-helix domain-containing protein [Micromonospora sp. SH-82]|uniref:helix-turn-helix domain-containing protein n=1 Tax=Micromonospora sp. SH-82 TaxID=3132938 RepID=UPI003EBE233E